MTESSGETIVINKDFGIFMAALYEQSAKDAAWTTNQLIDAFRERAQRAEALVEMIRVEIGDMMSGRYMPTSAAVERALYPAWDVVTAYMAGSDGTT